MERVTGMEAVVVESRDVAAEARDVISIVSVSGSDAPNVSIMSCAVI